MSRAALLLITCCLCKSSMEAAGSEPALESLPGTKPLTMKGDITSQLVDGVDRFLLKQIEASVAKRKQYWNYDFSSPEAFEKSIEPNRKRLAHILGVRDPRVPFDAPLLLATTNQPALVGEGKNFKVYAVRWPVLADPDPKRNNVVVHGEGLLLEPNKHSGKSCVMIPDADQTPEQVAGLTKGDAVHLQFARFAAEVLDCRVLIPTLISREVKPRPRPGNSGGGTMTNREYLYRSSFILGRHLIGYEVQKVLAGVDWLSKESGEQGTLFVHGYGEGAAIAMYAAALDKRIDGVEIYGYFGPRERMWEHPVDRNVFGLLEEFGDAEILTLLRNRKVKIGAIPGPVVTLPPGTAGAPGKLAEQTLEQVVTGVDSELDRLSGFFTKSQWSPTREVKLPRSLGVAAVKPVGEQFDAAARQQRQFDELDQFNQLLLRESPFVRKRFMSKIKTSSVKEFEQSIESYRKTFREDVIGEFDLKTMPFNPRTRKTWDNPKWTGYEVMLDVYPDVIAYGALLVPKDLKLDGSEKRPVVVCQHGLEGRPTDTFLNDHRAYHDFAAKLCERGFITFAPQNLYIFKDRFRTLQRKANPLGKTLFSVIVPQHQQIVDWLQSLPYVDPDRVAFYGLSYGGKSAMRIPALVTDYCLSICSADFNEWVRKNASTRHNFSYVWTGEYEIFEFDLGSTFNYAEMAALICPRPFMVERGHFDGVGEDEWVAYEFAKVRNLYQAKLGIGDRCEIEWFVGPHTINGKGTFAFLHKHLKWSSP